MTGYLQRSALIVGVSGLIGRNAARLLRDARYKVRGVSRGFGEYPSRSAMESDLKGVQLDFGDISRFDFARRVLRGVDLVVYAAGASGVAKSFADPAAARAASVDPWLQVLKQSELGARIVLISSQLVYGPSRGRPFSENDRPAPVSPYAVDRALMEQEGATYARSRALVIVTLRLGNIFGDILSVDHDRSHGLVALMLRSLVRDGEIRLLGGGEQTVNLLHVLDLAAAIQKVLEPPRMEHGGIFNLCGENLAVREVGDALRKAVGSGRLVSAPWPVGLERAVANNIEMDDAKFRDQFGWRPVRSVVAELERLEFPDGTG